MNSGPWFPPHTELPTIGGAHGPHDTRPTTRVSREATTPPEVSRPSPARASSRAATPAGHGTSPGRCGRGEDGGGGGPMATEGGEETAGQDLRADVPHHLWLSHPPRTDPGARVGQEPPLPDSGRPPQAEVAAAVAAPRAGSPGDPVAPSRGQKPCHPQSLAMDMGER